MRLRLMGVGFGWVALVALSGCSAEVPLRGSGDSSANRPTVTVAEPVAGARAFGAPGLPSSAQPVAPAGSSAFAPIAGPAANSGGPGSECGREKYRGEAGKLTIYTLFDESGSMLLWWGPVTEAFTRFLNDPRSAGINVGLKFFGLECDPVVYSKPDVAIGPLPQNVDAITQQLLLRIPLAQTPMAQALQGAVMAAQRHATEHSDEKVVILLVTDASSGLGEGDEEDCFSTVPQAAEVAARALAAKPSIQTYVLGLGDGAGLNALGLAGGTGEAFIADPSATDTVSAAMQLIRKRALPCDYALPAGGERTPDLVNLELTATTGTHVVPGVDNAQACDPAQGGWYYDNPATPKRLIACPATCEGLGAITEAHVVLGCPTVQGPD